MDFMGYVKQSETLYGVLLVVDTDGTPVFADALPTFRTYGPSGFLKSGTCSKLDSGSDIIDASWDTPIVITTSSAHGLTTGAYVEIAGVVGNTAANGSFFVTYVSSTTFSLDDSVGIADWVSGGTWGVIGAYRWEVDAESADGYATGSIYQILFSYEISSVATGQAQSFFVT